MTNVPQIPDLGAHWNAPTTRSLIGSAQFVQAGERMLKLFRSLGVEVNAASRLPLAVRLLKRINDREIRVKDFSAEQLEELADAQRTIWEFFIIGAATARRGKRAETPFTAEMIETALKGAPRLVDDKTGKARNTQFELYVAALLVLGGLEVHLEEPDLSILYWGNQVGVAAKRMSSISVDTLESRLDEAAEQVKAAIARGDVTEGFIAVNVDVIYRGTILPQDVGDRDLEFRRMTEHVWKAAKELFGQLKVIRGIIMFGFINAWDLEREMPLHFGAYPTAFHIFGEEEDPSILQHGNEFWDGVLPRIARELELLQAGEWEP